MTVPAKVKPDDHTIRGTRKAMRHYLGIEAKAARAQRDESVVYDPSELLNSHILITGMSGTGKSFQTKRLLETAGQSGIEIDIFDVHEEMENIEGAVCVKYSQATGYGYNPLILETDRHTGGVNRQADFLVSLLKEVSPGLGQIQMSVLRNLIVDTYAEAGIFPDDPATWRRRSVSEVQRDQMVALGRTADLKQSYPTLSDLRRFAQRKLTALTIGGDDPSVIQFEVLTRQVRSLRTAQTNASKAISPEETEKAIEKVNQMTAKCVEAYAAALEMQTSGRELDDILKYDSAQQISSLLARLDLLTSTGIFRASEPPFGNAKIKVHQIKALSAEQQILFVKIRMRDIFKRYVGRGPTASGTELRHVCFLDEAHRFTSGGGDGGIIGTIAREARKYGLGLWMASQSPSDFPDTFLSNVGATILLGIHSMFWKKSMSALRIQESGLSAIKPKEVIAVKLQRDGQSDPAFVNVIVPNPNSPDGRRASGHQRRHEHMEKMQAERLAPLQAAR